MKRIITLLVLFTFILTNNVFAQQPLTAFEKTKTTSSHQKLNSQKLKPIIKKALYSDVSKPLTQMKPIPGFFKFNNKIKEEEVPIIKLERNDNPFKNFNNQNPNIQKIYPSAKAAINIGVNVEGVKGADGYGVAPPDPHGDVGKTYYVQMVNNGTEIFDKSTGASVMGPFDSSTFWDGFSGGWDGTNDGDPIVMYDEQADRWVVTQFSVSNPGQYMLIAVSATNDPTGSYYRYAYEFTDMPDYPKLGIFLDSYVLTTNNFASSFTGTSICALNRTAMLAGPDGSGQDDPSMIIFFDDGNPSYIASEFSFTWMPADIEGDTPPSGTDIPFVFDMADEMYWGKDALVIAEMHVDWTTPANSTFTLSNEISITQDTDPGSEAPQPNGELLDLLNDRMMTRAQFRHFATYDAMVLCRTVDDGSNVAAIRWYELRNTGSGWSIYQQGTYAPGDGVWRFMPVIAMNGYGDIAIAYSTSGSSVVPSLRATGRYAGDPLNTMTITETELHPGNTSQDLGTYTRWGDYFSLMVDPSDDYTFWFTGEYSDGGWNWVTRVVEFALPVTNPPTLSGVTPTSLYEDRGKQLTITGTDLTGCTFTLGGITGTQVSNDGSTAVISFPAGDYVGSTLTATNAAGTANDNSVTVSTRNTIPVVSGAGVTSDDHPTIQSALDGLHAWYGTTAFDAGDLPGAKTINVSAGTYTEAVSLNSDLNPVLNNELTVQNNSGDVVVVDASGNTNGFDLSTVDYVTLKGFTVHGADSDNIYAQGNNVTISYNQTYGSTSGSGIKIETGTPFTVTNNLSYSNFLYGIHVNSSDNIIKNNTLDDNGGTFTPQSGVEIFNYDVESADYTGWATANGLWVVYDDAAYANSPTHSFMLDQGDDVLQYSFVDITGYDNLGISCYARSDASNMNNFDDLYGYYSFDNSTWTEFFHIQNDHPTYAQYSVSGITPTSTTLYIRFEGYCNAGEWWHIDDVVVTGDQTGSGSNTGAGLYVESGTSSTMENNIFSAKTGNDAYYTLISEVGATVNSDYNTYYTTNANLFNYNGTIDNAGPMGANDLTSDPVFIGSGDYHIFSTNGSYHTGEWPPLTAAAGTWTNDASNSPALDAGNPADSYANEPQSGNRINQGCYGNTVQASKTTAAVTYTWDGSTDNNWFDATNWTPEQVPASSDNVIIADVTNQPIINNSIGNIAECLNMTIDANADVTIDPDGYMTVYGSVTNNAGTSGLVINSDDSGTGSLIQNTSGGVDASVNCRLSSSGRQWHIIASPIAAAPLTVFPSTSYLYYYDESIDDYWTNTTYDSGNTGWTAPSGNLTVGKGYIYNYFAATLTYTGQLNDNTSTSAIAVPYTNNGGTALNGSSYDDFDGWSLIGNPYTSAIDWDNADVQHAAANLNDAVYTYDDTNLHNYTSYAGGTGTNGGTQYIPAMQGFFVKSDATETGGTLNIGTGARVHNAQTFWKSTYATPNNFLRLKISANGYTDETVVRFLGNATSDMDNGIDAYKLFTMDENVPQIWTNADGSTQYSINTLKAPESGSFSIPLNTIQTGDSYKIEVTEFNFTDFTVYLKDNIKNETSAIGLSDLIELSSDATDKEGRFELVFEKSASNVLSSENASVNLYPNPTKGQFYLTVGNTSDYTVTITNVTGQIVFNNKFYGNTSKMLDLSDQSSGIYFVNIQFSDRSSVTKKIVIE